MFFPLRPRPILELLVAWSVRPRVHGRRSKQLLCRFALHRMRGWPTCHRRSAGRRTNGQHRNFRRDVPQETARADVRVKTTADTLAVHTRDAGGMWRPMVSGQLCQNIDEASCCWALEKRRGGGQKIVIQGEKQRSAQPWDALLRASVAGSILEELGRDQVIVDAAADESTVCGRCGALVKASRMEAHTTMWCEAIADDDDDAHAHAQAAPSSALPEEPKSAASHLYWARSPTNPVGAVPPRRLEADEAMDALCSRVAKVTADIEADLLAAEAAQAAGAASEAEGTVV